jgi:antitoxin ParD1/3/4
MRLLATKEHKRHAQERLEALLLEGVNSGEPLEISPDYWERKRRQLVGRFNRKAGKSERPLRRSSAR